MIVWNRHIWLVAGVSATGRKVLVPFSVPHMVVKLRGVLHAAKPTLNHKSRRKTFDTLCGRRAHPVMLNLDTEHAIVPVWPMPTRFDMGERCTGCRVAADRKRPDAMYRDMTITDTPQAAEFGRSGGPDE